MGDLIVRMVDGYGFLPILKSEAGDELYRGEFQPTPEKALAKILERLEANKIRS